MHLLRAVVASALACASLVNAANILPIDRREGASVAVPHKVEKRAVIPREVTAGCTNGPNTRGCWSNGYNISTDWDKSWPQTGVYRHYNLVITNTTCNPDGGDPTRLCLLFNNQFPGPTLTANWGDWLVVNVTNKMPNNGTSIHWHGVRNLNTNSEDGTNGITECPIAPGFSRVYTFQATQYGTSWYHSHTSVQYGDGLTGALVFNGPASANYDVDLGPLPVSDWYYQTAFQVDSITTQNLAVPKGPPPSNNVLLNGTNMNIAGGGKYGKITVQKGKRYRLRIVSTAVDNAFIMSVDNHMMEIIASDFSPIKPQNVSSFIISAGQRYDIVLHANQPVGNYWLRANASDDCISSNLAIGKTIIHYDGAPNANPGANSVEHKYPKGCADVEPLTPYVSTDAGDPQEFEDSVRAMNISVYPGYKKGTTTINKSTIVWGINMTEMQIQWDKPTLSYVMEHNTSYPLNAEVIELPKEGVWSYWVLQNLIGSDPDIPHPMHLHGHDFFILGQGHGQFDVDRDAPTLNYNNPTRRDTITLRAAGWAVIAFETDNPGAWLFHCHIAWHISEGLGLQFLEAKDQIRLPGSSYQQQCQAWDNYYKGAVYKIDDSGI